MPVAMDLTVLASLFVVTVSTGTTTPIAADQRTNISKTVAEPSSLVVTTKNATTFTNRDKQPPAATPRILPVATSDNISTSSSLLTPPQRRNTTEEALPSLSPNVTKTSQTPNETVSRGSTLQPVSEPPNSTDSTTANMTTTGLSHNWEESDMEANPGLVAVLCMFCIIFVLVLVVVTLKCIQPPRSDFDDIEGVPLGERSPIAQYGK